MSLVASKWVWNQLDICGSAKLVLLRLADHADNAGGSVRPGIESVALHTGLSKRQVSRYIHDFVSSGVLIIEANEKGGRGKVTEYRFTFINHDTHVPVSSSQKDDTHDALKEESTSPVSPIGPKRVTPMTQKDDMGDHKSMTSMTVKHDMGDVPIVNRQEPSSEPSINQTNIRDQPAPRKRATQVPDPFVISSELVKWGEDERNRFSVDEMRDQVDQFVDYHQSRGTTRLDWDASFRTWMRNSRQFGSRHGPSVRGKSPPGPDEERRGRDKAYWLGTQEAGQTR